AYLFADWYSVPAHCASCGTPSDILVSVIASKLRCMDAPFARQPEPQISRMWLFASTKMQPTVLPYLSIWARASQHGPPRGQNLTSIGVSRVKPSTCRNSESRYSL